jgi:hypothetical protein
MDAEDLEQEFKSRALQYGGGLLLLNADDAIALIRRAADAGIPILGVDGMLMNESRTDSAIENIADYSPAVASGDGCWSQAADFIERHRPPGLVFEVTLGKSGVAGT